MTRPATRNRPDLRLGLLRTGAHQFMADPYRRIN